MTAVTIGKFDGFHLGHQLLLRTLKEFQNMEQVVCKIVFPGPGLMTIEEQETFVKEFGIHRFVKIPFSKEFAALPPETFVTDYLVKQLDVKHLVVGADFHFGYQRSGNVNTLKGLGRKYGFTVTALKKLEMDGSPVSSTRIRSCYETGDVRTAMRILGRPVVIPGIVRHGKELGRTIGFPTLNLIPEEDRLNYDLEACRNILIAAGVQDYDEDGQLEFMSGSPVEIELHFVVCADSSAKCGIARRFQEDMASIGLKVTVHELTWQEYMDALEEGQFKSGKQTVPVDMYYGEVKLRNNFDLTELLQPRDEDNELTNQNFSRSKDSTIVGRIERYLAAPDSTRADEFFQLCDYIMNTQGSLIVIGFEKQQIITRRGVCKGIDANFGNPLFGFPDWEIYLESADREREPVSSAEEQ